MSEKNLPEAREFEEPEVRFVEPEIEEAGELTTATGFFGSFSP